MRQLSNEEFHRLVFQAMAEMKIQMKKQLKKEVTQLLPNKLVILENRLSAN